jgi:outer membrane protein assembly factor BamD (BamD/ComL family)
VEQHVEAESRFAQMLRRFPAHESTPYARYYMAYAAYNRTLFDVALDRFGEVLRQTPDLDVAPDAAFRIAECHYNLEHYAEAGAAYRRFTESYPDSPLREDAVYNIAWCVLNALPAGETLPDMTGVKAAFSAYLDAYPDGSYVGMAQYTLAEIRFNEGDYDEAYALFTDIDARFPASPAAAQARQFIPRLLEAIAYREYADLTDDLNRALEAKDRRQLRALIPRLEALWRKYPETGTGVGAKLNIGVCYQNLGEWAAAVETFAAIIAAGDEGNAGVTPQVRGFSERRRAMITRRHL